ncbi:Very-short-patch-repair endonuclease [Rhizobium sp. NFR07]|uniref:endonuclease domain-containing protein n=1 Tax=Rhizobium sp. NFR07 TaxID=1566262 RepID=UPI0008EBE952|nr:endonuclease domain-containing protein [Rhizobium sp. NFR07]SFB40287.1 Very-short-patch-repair endonuclease [Rhizobium sp. NFR07]
MAWNREKPNPPSVSAARNALKLRRTMTDAERRLWTALRKELSEISGTHFRRQMAIGPYVADFVSLDRRLIVEVDGKIHEDRDQRIRDNERDAYLRGQEFRVMRFSNREVMLDMPSVLRRIEMALATPTPSPSPQGGGEQQVRP